MDNETLLQKLENQQQVIKELTAENEQLFQQFNHLMVRNGKLLKRIDDMQQIIDGMHLRIEESQLINDNLLKINDELRFRNDKNGAGGNPESGKGETIRSALDNIHRRIDELHLRNDVLQQRTSILSQGTGLSGFDQMEVSSHPEERMDRLYELWKKYPGQEGRNAPNLRKQSQMLFHLFENQSLNASRLFQLTGVNGVTGARYISVLKQFNLIEYKGARKKGSYFITPAGIDLVERSKTELEVTPEQLADHPASFESNRMQTLMDSPDL